jgi:hypothetical protein
MVAIRLFRCPGSCHKNGSSARFGWRNEGISVGGRGDSPSEKIRTAEAGCETILSAK